MIYNSRINKLTINLYYNTLISGGFPWLLYGLNRICNFSFYTLDIQAARGAQRDAYLTGVLNKMKN